MNSFVAKCILVLLAIPTILQIYIYFYIQNILAYLLPSGVSNQDEFDFIVVGAGSAGSTVAGRLVEKGYEVLLVEAGPPGHYLQSIPGMSAIFVASSPYVWHYKTEPLENIGEAYEKKKINIYHGKSLGGSSKLNFMQYVRSNSKDYDEWEALGNPGWKFKEVLPYFIKAERFHNPLGDQSQDISIDLEHHGKDGRLWVMPTGSISNINRVYLDAFKEAGYTFGDYNGAMQDDEVIFRAQVTQHSGLRADSYTSYVLNSNMEQSSLLKVLTFAQVTKLLFKDEKNVIVDGVEVNRFGETLHFRARKEVILSAGSIGSPKILMLSGIGPKRHLNIMKIPVIKDIPGVGENLQDHVMSYYMLYSTNTSRHLNANIFQMTNPFEILKYYITRTGPLGDNGIGVGMFYNTYSNKDEFKRPDIQLHTFPALVTNDYGLTLKEVFGQSDASYRTLSKYEGYDGGVLMPTLLRPESRGYVRLKSCNPVDNPIIQPNYFNHPKDVAKMVEALRIANKFVISNAFKNYNIEPIIDTENCGQFIIVGKPLTDDYFKCIIQYWTSSVWHLVGTCKMGPSSDPLAVVDHRLKVHGVAGLRIIDASVMPRITGGNTNAPTIMIGEKAADMIHKDWEVFDDDVRIKLNVTPKEEL